MAKKAAKRPIRKAAARKAPASIKRRSMKDFVIDMHTHIRVGPLLDYVRQHPIKGDGPGTEDWFAAGSISGLGERDKAIWPFLTDPKVRLREMDKQGVDIQVISTNYPVTCYWMDPHKGLEAARVTNDTIAEFCAAKPDRFIGIGSMPLQDPIRAARELERCVRELGLRGAWINSNVRAKDLGEEVFRPFWAKAQELDVPVFVHPLGTTDITRLKKYFLWNTIGQPYEEALAMSSLVYEGIMDDYPKLRVCICHGGGYLPYYIGRSDHAYEKNAAHQQDKAKRKPSAYLKRFHYDTVMFDPDMLPYLVKKAGASQVMMGSDWPLVRTDAVGYVRRAKGIGEGDKQRIMWKNSAEFLKIPL
jgi:aminocarboxymuconate-semialdehyde decarboxylase